MVRIKHGSGTPELFLCASLWDCQFFKDIWTRAHCRFVCELTSCANEVYLMVISIWPTIISSTTRSQGWRCSLSESSPSYCAQSFKPCLAAWSSGGLDSPTNLSRCCAKEPLAWRCTCDHRANNIDGLYWNDLNKSCAGLDRNLSLQNCTLEGLKAMLKTSTHPQLL